MHELAHLDEFDAKLLAALQGDGGASNAALAERVGLSPSQVSRRRLVLEASGVIAGYRAVLDHAALGLAIMVFVHVSLDTHSRDNARLFHELVRADPNVLEAYAMTGESDYLLKLVVSDLKALSRIVNEVLLPHPAVARIRSEVVLDTLKTDAALPIARTRGRV